MRFWEPEPRGYPRNVLKKEAIPQFDPLLTLCLRRLSNIFIGAREGSFDVRSSIGKIPYGRVDFPTRQVRRFRIERFDDALSVPWLLQVKPRQGRHQSIPVDDRPRTQMEGGCADFVLVTQRQ